MTMPDITLALFDANRLPVAIAAIILSAVIGMLVSPLTRTVNPLLWTIIGTSFGPLGERLDRKHRSKPDLLFRGALLLAVIIAIGMVLLKLETIIAAKLPTYRVIEILFLLTMISSGSLWAMLLGIYKAIEQKTTGQGAYLTLATSARLNLSTADDYTITRAAIGFAGRHMDRAFITPLILYYVFGLPIAWLFAILAAFTWRFGKSGFNSGFALLAQGLEKILGIIPAMLSALIIRIVAIITPGLNALRKADNKAAYDQGGPVLTALASAMNISLGGAFQDISGSAIKGEWVGPQSATAKNSHHHIKRTLFALIASNIIAILILLLLYLADNGVSPSFMLDLFA